MTDPTPVPTPTPPVPTPTPEPPKPDPTPAVTFTAEQQAELDRRIGAARRAAEAEATKKVKDAADAATAEADRLARIKAEEDKGNYESAKTALTGERDAAKAEADAVKASVAAYDAALAPLIESLLAEIPAEGREGFDDKAPALDRLTWLNERKALLTKLGVLAKDGQKPRQFPPNTPRSNGETLTGQEAETERARASGKYAPI